MTEVKVDGKKSYDLDATSKDIASLRQLLLDLLEYAESLPHKPRDTERLFIPDYYDPQTKFEMQAVRLAFAVTAWNVITANVALFALRAVIDRDDRVLTQLTEFKGIKTLDEVAQLLRLDWQWPAKCFGNDTFPPHGPFERSSRDKYGFSDFSEPGKRGGGKYKMSREPEDVEIWTFGKIREALLQLFKEKTASELKEIPPVPAELEIKKASAPTEATSPKPEVKEKAPPPTEPKAEEVLPLPTEAKAEKSSTQIKVAEELKLKTYRLDELAEDPEDYRKFLLDLMSLVASLPDEWAENRVFIDGEFDSNQSDFEEMSNKLQIGVRAKSTVKGYMTLLFLRLHIDRGYWWPLDLLDDHPKARPCFSSPEFYDRDVTLTLAEVLEHLKEQENQYTTIFAPSEPIQVEMWTRQNGKSITVTRTQTLDEIDIWTLSQLRTVFERTEIPECV